MPQREIDFLIVPDLTQLDFTGPLQALSRLPGARTHVVTKSLNERTANAGVSLLARAVGRRRTARL
jgi:cyclohexyl-isocyanide hydratase